MSNKKFGSIGKNLEETVLEWNIPDFFSIAEKKECYESSLFYFADVSWYFQLYPRSESFPGFIHLYFYINKSREYPIEYNFGLKKMDGSVENSVSGTLDEKAKTSKSCNFKLDEVLKNKSELAPLGVVTVICTLKLAGTNFTAQRALDKPDLNKLIKLDTLSQNFKDLLANKESCDTILMVQDKEFKAHKSVLIARSKVFSAMFLHDTTEKQTGIVTIPDCDPQYFEDFLAFLYCGKLEELSYHSVMSLYGIADKYDIEELKAFCSQFLMKNITVENVCNIIIFADKFDDAPLISAIQNFFSEYLNEIFQTDEWEDLLKNNYRLGNKFLKGMPKKSVTK